MHNQTHVDSTHMSAQEEKERKEEKREKRTEKKMRGEALKG